MATKNFTQFNTATPLTTSDYVVGYKADGSAEIKTQVQNIVNLVSLSAYVKSDNTTVPAATAVNNIIALSQEAYDAISIKDPNILYFIV